MSELARSRYLCFCCGHWLMRCRASLAVRGSLRQSHFHGLSRQHTAIMQTSSSFILIVPGLPCPLFGFHLFVFSLTAQSRGMPLRYWHCHLHRSPCSCSAQCTLPHTFLLCHLCDEGKGLLLLPYSFPCTLFTATGHHPVRCNQAPERQNIRTSHPLAIGASHHTIVCLSFGCRPSVYGFSLNL